MLHSAARQAASSAGAGRQYLEGETSAQAAARKHGLTVAEIEEWRERFLLGAEDAL
jgi:hypothetical protein